ncbi:MAG: right-handed parallel beta-helix repeat-containing protein, partial [Candidatus Paceibacterota bacterium]
MNIPKNNFFLVFFIFCSFVGMVHGASATVYLTPHQGIDNNQVYINEALNNEGARENGILTVHLRGGTYVINDKVLVGSNTVLEGDSNAIIKLVDNANWPREEDTPGGMLQGKNSSVTNVRITGFEIDGNGANNTTSNGVSTVCGKYYYTMLYFRNATNLEVDNMKLHDNWNDILKFSGADGVKFHNNTVWKEGHDVVYAISSKNVWVYDNNIKIACNSGVRPYNTQNISIYGNDITRDGSGYAGIEIQSASTVWICDNNIYNTLGGSIVDLSGGAATIHYDNCPIADSSTIGGNEGGNDDSGNDDTNSENTDNSDTSNSSDSTNHPTFSYTPTSSILDSNPFSDTNPALSAEEQTVDSVYPKLGDAPASATEACIDVENSKGLIPCGRNTNDPATAWNECSDCTLCSLLLMGQLSIEFLVKVAGVAATLAIILSGFLYVLAAGRT